MIKSDIKPISRGMRTRIKQYEENYMSICGRNITKYYSYVSELANGNLALYTVAVKYHPVTKKLMMKQVIVKDKYNIFINDLDFYNIAGYQTDWSYEIENEKTHTKWYDCTGSTAWKPTGFIINESDLQFSKYRYSGYQYYRGEDLFGYLMIWEEHNGVEYLAKNGLWELAHKKRIVKKCEEDKKFAKYLVENRVYIQAQRPSVQAMISSYDFNIDLEKQNIFTGIIHSFKSIKKAIEPREVERALNYMKHECNMRFGAYNDYLEACMELGLDMNDTKNKYPHDFQRWHDIRVDQYTMKKKEDSLKEMNEVVSKYSSLELQDGFCVILAKSKEDLENEGEALHHCVGRMNYDKRMIDEKSLIFFVRKKKNVPFVTIEYSLSDKKVLQCYGDHDSKPEPKILDFVYNKWQKYANKQLNKIRRAA